jgi:PAS domain S-box-containing protein
MLTLPPSTLDFGALFDASPNPYMVADRGLTFVAVNQAYVDVTGRTREALLGRKILEVFPHDPADPNNESQRLLRASFERVLATKQRDVLAVIHYRIAKGDGHPLEDRYWSATHTPLFDAAGEVAFVLQHTVDVTELHRLKSRSSRPSGFGSAQVEAGVLQRAEVMQEVNRVLDVELRHLRRLFDQSPGFVCILRGPTHVFEITNRAYDRLIGRDAVGRSVLEAMPEVESQGFIELLDQV